MNKLFLYGIIVAALCTACATNENAAGSADKNAAEVKPAVNDKVECAKLSDIKMGGYVGEKMDAFFKNRVLSDEAKNKIFEEAEKALDGNVDTLWHSNRDGCTQDQAWISIDMKQSQTVSALQYVPRQAQINGLILEYKIEFSTDGSNWRKGKNARN